MSKILLTAATLAIIISACVSSSRSTSNKKNPDHQLEEVNTNVAQVDPPAGLAPDSLTDLARTEDGGFVLAPGLYEAEFKTYCLQPGTPDPSPRDAYLQAPITGYRKDIIETVLFGSRRRSDIEQRHVQLLLWSIVSGSDFNKLSQEVQTDARQLLTSRQVFELNGGVLGVVKNVSNKIPSGSRGLGGVKRLFEMGTSSYEAYEKIAVLNEPSKIKRPGFKNEQWYKQEKNFYVRYFPVSYKRVRIQVYVPEDAVDADGKAGGEYLVFDPTAMQVIPANSNAQRLGVGGTVIDIIRKVIIINRPDSKPKKQPEQKKPKKGPVKALTSES